MMPTRPIDPLLKEPPDWGSPLTRALNDKLGDYRGPRTFVVPACTVTTIDGACGRGATPADAFRELVRIETTHVKVNIEVDDETDVVSFNGVPIAKMWRPSAEDISRAAKAIADRIDEDIYRRFFKGQL